MELLEAAQEFLDKDESSKCIEKAQEALVKFTEAEDLKSAASARCLIVNAYRLEADQPESSQEALKYAETEYQNCSASGDTAGQAAMLLSLAECKLDLKTIEGCDEALLHAEEAVSFYRGDLADKPMQGAALLVLVRINYRKKVREEVKESAKEAIQVFGELQDKKGQATAMKGLALSYIMSGEYDEGLKVGKEMLVLARESGSKKCCAECLSQMAQWYAETADPMSGVNFAREAVEILIELGCSKGQDVEVLDTTCDCFIQGKKPKYAMKLARKIQDKYEKLGSTRLQLVATRVLIQAYVGQKDFMLAKKALDEATKTAKTIGDKQLEASFLGVQAKLHLKMGAQDKAIEALEAASEMFTEAGESESSASAMFQVSELKYKPPYIVGDCSEALNAATESRKLFQAADNRSKEAAALLRVGYLEAASNELEKAMESAKEAEALGDEIGEPRTQAAARSLMCDIHLTENAHDKALGMAKKAQSLLAEVGDQKASAGAARKVATVLLESGDVETAAEEASESAQLFKAAGDKAGLAAALLLVCQANLTLLAEQLPADGSKPAFNPHLVEARKAAVGAMDVTKYVDDQDLRATALYWLAQVCLFEHKVNKALGTAEEAARIYEAMGHKGGQAQALVLKARILMLTDQKEGSSKTVDQALSLFREVNDMFGEGTCLELIHVLRPPMQMQMIQQPMYYDESQMEQQETAASAVTTAPKSTGLSKAMVHKKVLETLKMAISDDDDELGMDSALMEAGLDSLASVELVTTLSREFQMQFSPSLMFDFPTGGALADHIVETSQG